jgi:hypothetical protein
MVSGGGEGRALIRAARQRHLGSAGHERYGFLELKKPEDAWAIGTYLVKLFITPLGQQSFHAGNQVGTMRFTIVEGAVPAGVSPY